MRLALFFIALITLLEYNGQVDTTSRGSFKRRDSVILDLKFGAEDAIYLSHEDFKMNSPILKELIISSHDKTQAGFINKIISSGGISFYSGVKVAFAESSKIWGFIENNTFYLNTYNGKFCRIIIFGSLCYLVERLDGERFVLDPSGQLRGFHPELIFLPNYTNYKAVDGMKPFLLNLRKNEICDLGADNFKRLISGEKGLLSEYEKLTKKEQKKQIYTYIRRYNELHPFYVPKN